MSKVGIGVATYNRPESFFKCLQSVRTNAPEGALLYVSDDGSDNPDYDGLLDLVEQEGITVYRGEHANIATSKNRLLKGMMDDDVEHLFIVEDDMEIIDDHAFADYISGYTKWDMQHSMFAHHGTRNSEVGKDIHFTYHYEVVGAFCYYHRNAIETVGFMDENFQNAWEHCVHSMLIGDANLMPGAGWRRWPDVRRSPRMIREIPAESTHGSVTEDELMAQERIQAGLRYWQANYRFPDELQELIK